MMLRALLALAWMETLRLLRSPVAFGLIFAVPALQLALFGYAIRPSGSAVEVVLASGDPGDANEVRTELRRWPGIRVADQVLKPGGAAASVKTGQAQVGIEVPTRRSFYNPTAKGGPFRITVDGSDPALVDSAMARIEAAYWRRLAAIGADPIEGSDIPAAGSDIPAAGPGLTITRLYNPAGRADWNFLPALIGVTVMISMIMLGTLSLAREREGGTWEGLLALPLDRWLLLAGKLLPYVVIATLQGALVLLAGAALFDLPMRGATGALILLLPLFAAAHLALGHALAARAKTQLAALQGAVGFYLPAMLLSGFLYPFQSLPGWAQALGSCFPLTHFVRAARAATLKGAGAAEVLGAGLPIALFAAVAAALALLLQARRLD